ncbi:MerR family transcriptional regulator [Amycolatopsis antarctica]|uniref:MerR family transcriptional regulator n=1 Tax=Amycolatopsis antarctica TaxID=1854586 RepID=A0A263D027_9PSEU|nr:MerR family transcriptional regulator [Amycolatopsis antarctica]OZM70896.1 MerR family transcriptional regulator [Amycolatopsis antarctica]
MRGSTVFTIGELARRTGLPVKTIRFYSDEGLLPPTDRTPSGYRLYDTAALARLELVKTLRELGIGLSDVDGALAGTTTVPALAARHVEALDEQIRRLRLRRSVLRAVAKRESELDEVKLMNKLASMSDEERRALLDEFWAEVSSGLEVDPDLYEWMRSAKPDLPDDPSPEQLEAWIELAELVRDKDFRALIRGMSEGNARRRAEGEDLSPPDEDKRNQWAEWADRAHAHLEAGLDPASPEGRELADEIANGSATPGQEPGDPAFRRELADKIASGSDPRAERYWQLLATINGWPPVPTRQPAMDWFIGALRASAN